MDKKRKAFTLETKVEILNEIKKGTKKKAVAEAFTKISDFFRKC